MPHGPYTFLSALGNKIQDPEEPIKPMTLWKLNDPLPKNVLRGGDEKDEEDVTRALHLPLSPGTQYTGPRGTYGTYDPVEPQRTSSE